MDVMRRRGIEPFQRLPSRVLRAERIDVQLFENAFQVAFELRIDSRFRIDGVADGHAAAATHHPPSFTDDCLPIARPAEDLHEQDDVERTIGERQMTSIGLGERAIRGTGRKLPQHCEGCIHAEIAVASCDESSANSSSPGAYIEHAGGTGEANRGPYRRANGLRHFRGKGTMALERRGCGIEWGGHHLIEQEPPCPRLKNGFTTTVLPVYSAAGDVRCPSRAGARPQEADGRQVPQWCVYRVLSVTTSTNCIMPRSS